MDWYSTKCRLIWNLRATTYNRTYFLLQVSTRPTSASAFGLLPTVRANKWGLPDSHGNTKAWQMLPTPRTSDGNGAGLHGDGGMDLRTAAQLIPTPTVNGNNNRKGLSEKSGDGLSTWAKKMLPTPTTNDSKNSSLPASQKDRDGLAGTMLTSGMTGQLNPRFVEWMMGYPTGWTELEGSETP